MSGILDPSGLPRWFLLLLLAIALPVAMSQGYLDPSYLVFGSSVRVMDISGSMFVVAAVIGTIAYIKWM